jgi:hypothetical protein
VIVPLAATWALFPQLDYLPPVKRDAVDAFVQTPPGSTWDMKEKEIVGELVKRLEPYMSGQREPALKNYYIWLFAGGRHHRRARRGPVPGEAARSDHA